MLGSRICRRSTDKINRGMSSSRLREKSRTFVVFEWSPRDIYIVSFMRRVPFYRRFPVLFRICHLSHAYPRVKSHDSYRVYAIKKIFFNYPINDSSRLLLQIPRDINPIGKSLTIHVKEDPGGAR